jgi:hypothetical protein
MESQDRTVYAEQSVNKLNILLNTDNTQGNWMGWARKVYNRFKLMLASEFDYILKL